MTNNKQMAAKQILIEALRIKNTGDDKPFKFDANRIRKRTKHGHRRGKTKLPLSSFQQLFK